MDFKDTLEERLNDPEFCRELLAELRGLTAENERMRKALESIKQQIDTDGWKDQIIAKCFRAAEEGLGWGSEHEV